MTKDILPNFDCNKNTVVEASAGTGKTHTITNFIVPHLLEYPQYSLSNILIVTYTEKAAGELRSRIRKELTKLSQETTSESLRNKIDQEIEKIDDAPIFTIHSFCHKTLTENAIYSNCSQNLTLIDEDAGLENFIGQYIRDNLSKDKIFIHLYANTSSNAHELTFPEIMKDAIKKYYLNNKGDEVSSVISLDKLSDIDNKRYNKLVNNLKHFSNDEEYTNAVAEISNNINLVMSGFVLDHIKEIYMAWQKEKEEKKLQTYGDMVKIVHDAIIDQDSKLLSVLKEKYKYAIIDEFQDTNQLQWDIFKQIFTTDNEHHITIVGDPKQSIYSFQGADSAVYNIAKEYINNSINLSVNYRSSGDMIRAINVLSKNEYVCNYSDKEYQDVQIPDDTKKHVKPAKLHNKREIPIHIINESCEKIILSKIIEYCTKNPEGETALQIWDKNKGAYRNVNFNDFAVLVRARKDANKLIEQMRITGIPFMWHKDSSLFAGKEVADWIALLSAIQTPDFNAKNREILRQVLQTEFFDISINNISDEKFNDILCPERQRFLKWHNLAENRQYAKLLNAIFEDSGISKRLASYDKIQSLSKYNQIGNFILDYLISKHGSISTVIKILKQRKTKDEEDDEISVEKATDNSTVKISTIHSAKGLEYPIVFYFILPQAKSKKNFVRIVHDKEQRALLNIDFRDETNDPDFQSLRYVAITRATSLMFLINIQVSTKYYQQKYAIPESEKLVSDYHDLFTIDTTENSTPEFVEKIKNILASNNNDNTDAQETPCNKIDIRYKKLYKHSYTSLSHHQTETNENDNDLITERSERIDKEGNSDLLETNLIRQYDTDSGVKIYTNMYNVNDTIDVSAPMYSERGTKYGTVVHEVFEQIDFTKFATNDQPSYTDYLVSIIDNYCKKRLFLRTKDDMARIRGKIITLIINTMMAKFPEIIGNHATGKNFKLSSLKQNDRKPEIEFNLNPNKQLLNYCNGFIDLLFVREIEGKKVFSILDWKTDFFAQEDYANYDYLKSHTDERYAIQRVLYSYCLIQWLKQFYPEQTVSEIFDNYFGGIYYVYVRGCNAGTGNGIYAHTWQDYKTLENAFKDIIKGIYNG